MGASEPIEGALQHFQTYGWMRIERAFSDEAARLMRDVIWRALALAGIDRDQPATWKIERPTHLQQLKNDPVFRAIASEPLLSALNALFAGRAYDMPTNWGAFFIAFPSAQEWTIPRTGWHIDAHYGGALWPAPGVKTHALLDDIAPRGGGTLILSGSHRLVHNWFKAHPPPSGMRSAEMRRLLQSQPYIRELHAPGEPHKRIARFMERTEEIDGMKLRVVENTGCAGDIILVHPLVLHVASPNNSSRPRFLLSGGVTTDQWGWRKSPQGG